jgi:hypothetical protein
MGVGMGVKSEPLLDSPLVMEANTEMARLAGCSHWGQSAPVAFIDCNLSNL